MDELLKNKVIDKKVLNSLINYYGINRFKRLYKHIYKKEINRGGKGDIPNLVLRQLGCMTKCYGPYKEDERNDN